MFTRVRDYNLYCHFHLKEAAGNMGQMQQNKNITKVFVVSQKFYEYQLDVTPILS